MRPGRGWTKTCFTFCAARSRSVLRICSSVRSSFQTQSGAVEYSRGGSAKSFFTAVESSEGAGGVRAGAAEAASAGARALREMDDDAELDVDLDDELVDDDVTDESGDDTDETQD